MKRASPRQAAVPPKKAAKATAKKSAKKTAEKTAKKPAKRASPKKPSATTTKKAPKKAAKKPAAKKAAPFGRPGTAGKADGDAPVRAYLATLPPEHRAVGVMLDTIITQNVPGVTRAMKWSVPFYGLPGKGWFCSFAAFKNHCAVNFFRGRDLKPQPPEGEAKDTRRVRYEHAADVDTPQLTAWVKQAAALPGWGAK